MFTSILIIEDDTKFSEVGSLGCLCTPTPIGFGVEIGMTEFLRLDAFVRNRDAIANEVLRVNGHHDPYLYVFVTSHSRLSLKAVLTRVHTSLI